MQYFGHQMWTADSLEKTLMLGKIEGRRIGCQRIRRLNGITKCNGHELQQTPGDGKGQEGLVCCSPWGHKESNTTGKLNNNNHFNGRKWRGTKELLSEGERGEWKSWLKTQHSKNKDHGIWSPHFMASRKKVEMVTDVIFLGSKITADGDCSHEIKRCLLLGRKVMTNPDSILKSRDITLLTNVHLVKAMGFSYIHVQMWELSYKEGWVLKNWCFRSMVLEKTLEGP